MVRYQRYNWKQCTGSVTIVKVEKVSRMMNDQGLLYPNVPENGQCEKTEAFSTPLINQPVLTFQSVMKGRIIKEGGLIRQLSSNF